MRLTLAGEVFAGTADLPRVDPGTAVRIYNRKFLADAREGLAAVIERRKPKFTGR